MLKLLDKLLGFFWLKDLVDWINGRKTVIGIISLLLGVAIQVVPAVFPEASEVSQWAERIQDFLINIGVVLTPVGAGHKVVKRLKRD